MAFTNNPLQLELVIPENGSLTPGSSTLYIGGPRLPADMIADGVTAALIWYSSAQGLALGIDYWYIAQFNIPPSYSDLLQMGYQPSGGGSRVPIWGGFVTALGTRAAVFEAPDQLVVQSNDTFVYADDVLVVEAINNLFVSSVSSDVYLETNDLFFTIADQLVSRSGGAQFLLSNYASSQTIIGWENNGTSIVYADADTGWTTSETSGDIDTWLTASSTQTVLGVANTVCTSHWRISYDRQQEAYVQWIFPGVPAALNGSLPLPPAYTAGGPDDRALWRTPSLPPGGRLVFGLLYSDDGAWAVNNVEHLLHRIASPFNGVTLSDNAGNPNAQDRIFMQLNYQVDKP